MEEFRRIGQASEVFESITSGRIRFYFEMSEGCEVEIVEYCCQVATLRFHYRGSCRVPIPSASYKSVRFQPHPCVRLRTNITRMKARQFIRKLKAHGVEIETGRGKGGHVLATFEGRRTVIKTHGAKDLSNRYIQLVCRQLGIEEL